MPAKSKKQKDFMGMVLAIKRKRIKPKSKALSEAARSMTEKEAKDFASTKREGLPKKLKKK